MISIKIAVVCSPGGHFTEMTMLSEIFEGKDAFLITHKEMFETNLSGVYPNYLIPNLVIGNAHKNILFKKVFLMLHILIITLYELFIFLKERPSLIISTGSEIAIPIFLIGAIFKVHTIYIESITRINEISTTGKVIYRFADLFLVQHEKLLEKYPKALYKGSII